MKKTASFSRRDLGVLIPLLAAGRGAAQSAGLVSKACPYEDLPVMGAGPNHFRPVLNGELHTGFALEIHETELGPGLAPHPPHRHVHEEVIVVREGTLEVTIAGRSSRLGAGSVAFMASNEEHGWRNVADTRARYLLFALGPDWNYRKSVGSGYSAKSK